jgi:signal transduction histidine kinase
VHADPDDMYSVLQNLITNSVKFARPEVPAAVRISSRRTADGWRLSVSDNGVGIPEDRRVDVFSLFTRVATEVSGHGIGLATVARIVAAHSGRVGAESVPEGGAEIWFELPDEPAAS